MELFRNPFTIVLLIGAVQGLILSLLLVIRKGRNDSANRILAIILLLFSISILLHSFSHAVFPLDEKHQIIIGILSVLSAPLILIYVRTLTAAGKPVALPMPVYLPALLAVGAGGLQLAGYSTIAMHKIYSFVYCGCMLFYISSSLLRLAAYTKEIKNEYAALHRVNLVWLRGLLLLLTIFWLTAIFVETIFNLTNWDLLWTGGSIIVFFIGNFGFVQPEIFASFPPGVQETSKQMPVKYERSALDGGTAEIYLSRLQTIIKRDRCYLDPDLSLAGLSRFTGIAVHHLSQIINEKLKMNFYEYINSLRIGEARDRLSRPEFNHLTIASIGHDSGFSTLSTFNSCFKKYTRTTPSKYRAESVACRTDRPV